MKNERKYQQQKMANNDQNMMDRFKKGEILLKKNYQIEKIFWSQTKKMLLTKKLDKLIS